MVTDVCQDCGESVDEEGGEDTCEDGDKGGGQDAEDGYEGGFLPDRHMDEYGGDCRVAFTASNARISTFKPF